MTLEFYKDQLAEVEALLSSTPYDESLPKLKDDILELIELTKLKAPNKNDSACLMKDKSSINSPIPNSFNENNSKTCSSPVACTESTKFDLTTDTDTGVVTSTSRNCKQNIQNIQKIPVKNSSKFSSLTNAKILNEKFEIPSHLLPLPSDTEVDRSRKRRTVKALKSKFRSRQKSVETEVRKKSWQEFVNKGNKKKGGYISSIGSKSIFATEDGINAKVGVISGGLERGGEATNDRYIKRKRLRNDF